jgi:hypothetical protein
MLESRTMKGKPPCRNCFIAYNIKIFAEKHPCLHHLVISYAIIVIKSTNQSPEIHHQLNRSNEDIQSEDFIVSAHQVILVIPHASSAQRFIGRDNNHPCSHLRYCSFQARREQYIEINHRISINDLRSIHCALRETTKSANFLQKKICQTKNRPLYQQERTPPWLPRLTFKPL